MGIGKWEGTERLGWFCPASRCVHVTALGLYDPWVLHELPQPWGCTETSQGLLKGAICEDKYIFLT